jgi:hypothetical protein
MVSVCCPFVAASLHWLHDRPKKPAEHTRLMSEALAALRQPI